MKVDRQWLKSFFCPGTVVLVMLIIFSAFSLTLLFVNGMEQSIAAYGIYALSAYTLTAAVIRSVSVIRWIRERLDRIVLYRRYRSDLDFRAFAALHLSLIVTLFYCVIKAAAGIYYRSVWFGAMAFYYLVLCVARFLLLVHARQKKDDWISVCRIYRLCGYVLFVLTAALSTLSFYTIAGDQSVVYPGFMIYAAAAFTFYSLITAVCNVVRYRRLRNPIYTAAQICALTSALVSLFFLQASLLSVFGSAEAWEVYMNIVTGAVVYIVIAALAVWMVRSGNAMLQNRRMESD